MSPLKQGGPLSHHQYDFHPQFLFCISFIRIVTISCNLILAAIAALYLTMSVGELVVWPVTFSRIVQILTAQICAEHCEGGCLQFFFENLENSGKKQE